MDKDKDEGGFKVMDQIKSLKKEVESDKPTKEESTSSKETTKSDK